MGSPFRSRAANERAASMSNSMKAFQDKPGYFAKLLGIISSKNAADPADPKPSRDIVISQPDPEAYANSRLNPIPDVIPVDVNARAGMTQAEPELKDLTEQERLDLEEKIRNKIAIQKLRDGGMR